MELVAAALAGAVARLLSHPLDTIKTVTFTGFASSTPTPGASASSYSFTQALRRIWSAEGLRGFYRGAGVTVLGAAPGVGLYLSSYQSISRFLEQHSTCWFGDISTHHLRHWISFSSGLLAEAVSCLVWVPIDVTKERLQSQPRSLVGRYTGSWNALHTMYQLEGLKGFYKGYWSTIGSFGPFSGVYFVFYEYFTGKLTALSCALPTLWVPLLAGCGGTTVACFCTNPLELVKTRLQVQRTPLRSSGSTSLFTYEYSGLCNGIVQLARREGLKGLWRGTGARIAYQAPNSALTMSLYEYLRRRWITGEQ